MAVQLVPFDRTYLDLSWSWLQDEETKRLTMTPEFTREDQLRFFDSLPGRSDYRVWGVSVDGVEPIGAAGLKHIAGGTAEYWGYIGNKDWWGRGLGRQLVQAVEREASQLDLGVLTLSVTKENQRAIRLYQRAGYRPLNETQDKLVMRKELASGEGNR